METLDQRFGFRIGVGIEQLLRLSITTEKTFQPQHVAVVGAADDDRAAGAAFEEAHAAQDQRAHDPLAELGFRDQQGAKPVLRNDQGLHRLCRDGVRQ